MMRTKHLKYLLLCLFLFGAFLLSACSIGSDNEVYTRIACICEGKLTVVDPDSGSQTVLAEGEHIYRPMFSPNGFIVYYMNGPDIFWVNTTGGTPSLAAANATPAGFDATGRLISCSADYGIRAFNPNDGTTEFLWQTYSGGFAVAGLVSPKSARLGVLLAHTDVGVLFPDGLDIINRESADDERWRSADICGEEGLMTVPFAWSSDEGSLIVSCYRYGSQRATLYTLPVIEGASTLLTDKNITVDVGTVPVYAADGKSVAFPAYRSAEDTTRTICTVNLTTLSVSYATSPISDVTGVALSPTGNKTVYTAGIAENGSIGLFATADGTTICLTGDTTTKMCTAPKISNLGKKVWFISVEDRALAVTDDSGTAVDTYKETVASVSWCNLNSNGATIGVDHIDSPDGLFNDQWQYMYDVFEAVPGTESK